MLSSNHSEEDVDLEDILEAKDPLEEEYERAKKEGEEDGLKKQIEKSIQQGQKKGAEIGLEVGFLDGFALYCIDHFKDVQEGSGAIIRKEAEKMRQQIKGISYDDPASQTLLALINRIQARQKVNAPVYQKIRALLGKKSGVKVQKKEGLDF